MENAKKICEIVKGVKVGLPGMVSDTKLNEIQISEKWTSNYLIHACIVWSRPIQDLIVFPEYSTMVSDSSEL